MKPPLPKPPLPKKPSLPPPKKEAEALDSAELLLVEDEPAISAPVPSVPDPPTVPLAPKEVARKPRWIVPTVLGSGGVVVLIACLAVGKAACGARGSTATSSATATASAAAPSSAARPAPLPPIACGLGAERRSIATKALAASGVEVSALGPEIAVGFAATPNDATLELLDPSNASTVTRVLARSNDPIRRVLALSRTTVTLDVDRAADPLHARRTLLGDPPVDVGGTADGFGWAPHKSDKATKLWTLPQPTVPVEQVRGDALPDSKGFAIAFRQGSVVYAGAFGGSPPAPLGPLVHVDGLGTTGGAPVIAASGERVMIAWSDRAETTEPWHLRTATFKVGDDAAEPHAFAPPPGGLGEQTMSPDLTPLGGGRFLLLWTEGAATHQVRGAVLGEEGAPSSAFAVSADGSDAGQGQAAVLGAEDATWRGVVAFLSSTSPGFYEVVAAPLKCAAK